jgi:hypothetical protein
MGEDKFGGLGPVEARLHIEEAHYLACSPEPGSVILVAIDNSTVVSYIAGWVAPG